MCSRLMRLSAQGHKCDAKRSRWPSFVAVCGKTFQWGSETGMDSLSPAPSVYLGPLVPGAARHRRAPIAQQAERLHGKEKVCGSIPHGGSDSVSGATAHRRNMRAV
jgi:hypothetical protein